VKVLTVADDIIGPPLPEIISRKDAIAKGLPRYFLGRPCKYGHVAEQNISGGCVICHREQHLKAARKRWAANPEMAKARREVYRAANPDKAKATQAAYFAANKEKIKASSAIYRAANKERVKARRDAYRAANPERVKATQDAYRAANPDKVKARREAYSVANPEKIRASSTAYRTANPDKVKASSAAYIAKNPEKLKARGAAYRASNKEKVKAREVAYRVNNKAKLKAGKKSWEMKNPENVRVRGRRRRARLRNAEGVHTAADIKEIHSMQKGRCAICRQKLGQKYHVDHIQPLARGGSDDRANLQLACGPCNLRKADRDPIEHMQSLGMLL
jgi:5-methylcytosine-specific restriction endonuclease McrA